MLGVSEIDRLLQSRLQDPYPLWRQVRAEDPVHWIYPFGPWIFTRYADIVGALREPRLGVVGYGAAVAAVPEEDRGSLRTFFGVMDRSLVHSNPPAHTRLRRLVAASFTPRVTEGLRPWVARDVTELLDSAAERGGMDGLHDFAYPLLARVTAQLVGVPRDDLVTFQRHFDAYYRSFGRQIRNEEGRRSAESAAESIVAYFRTLLAARRREPQDDLMSAMLAAADDMVTEDELASLCIQALFSGRESTPNFIANALWTLLSHPAELERLRRDPGLMPSAVEELLRYEGSTPTVSRVALAELEVGGKRIGAGQRVLLITAAANRDPERFPDPDRLDLARPNNHHLSFGHGTHFCLGAAVARMVAQSALWSVLERFPGLRLAAERVEWRTDTPNRFLCALPLTW